MFQIAVTIGILIIVLGVLLAISLIRGEGKELRKSCGCSNPSADKKDDDSCGCSTC